MRKRDLEKFEALLKEQRDNLLNKQERLRREELQLDTNDMPDESDLASAEYNQGLNFRLRARERTLVRKINKALRKIDEGVFGICEECEEPINLKRLKARPVTTLCIRCKEVQERTEKMYA